MNIEPDRETGYLYCLSNPAMPGLVKIGYTNRRTAIRAEELSFGSRDSSATGVPLPFEIVKDWRVPSTKAFEIEQLIHKKLHIHRVAPHGGRKPKEFFHLTPSEAVEQIERSLKELDWWSVAQAKQSQFDAEIRARAARVQIDQRVAILHSQWWSGVQSNIRKGQGIHYAATTKSLESAGLMVGFKWASIWFFGSMIVFFGMADAKDSAIWICLFFGGLAFFMTKDGAADSYRLGNQYAAELNKLKNQTIEASKQNIEIECPNNYCKKTLIFSIHEDASVANIRCPACKIIFKWAVPDA